MKLKASLKRAARLTLIGLRNGFYRLFGHKDYQKFIIITRSRTGSNLLISLLDSHPNIEAYGEMFNRLHGRASQRVWNGVFGFKSKSIQLVGFKIFYYHPLDADDNWVWDRVYNDISIPIIHLTRTNLLRTYLSRQIADKTHVWRDEKGNKAVDTEDKRVTLDPDECKAEFIKTEKWVKEADACIVGHRVLQVTYEELTGDGQEACLNRIQEFLKVNPLKLSSGMNRQNAEDIEKLVLNYDELARSLKGTEWERFL